MKNDKNLSGQFASYLYNLETVKHVNSSSSLFQHETSWHGILLFKEAKGEIVINRRSYPLHWQKVHCRNGHGGYSLVTNHCQADTVVYLVDDGRIEAY